MFKLKSLTLGLFAAVMFAGVAYAQFGTQIGLSPQVLYNLAGTWFKQQIMPSLGITGGAGGSVSQSTQSYQLANCNNSVNFPIPCFYPTGAANQFLAVDIFPKGAPGQFAATGNAWVDICNRDLIQFGGSAFNCLHLATYDDGRGFIDTTNFNGASVTDLVLGVGGNNNTLDISTTKINLALPLNLNLASGFSGTPISVQINGGSPIFSVDQFGDVLGNSFLAGSTSIITWNGRTLMTSPSDGNILFTNNAATSFSCLDLGGVTSSFDAICANGNETDFKYADLSQYGTIGAENIHLVAPTGFSANFIDATINGVPSAFKVDQFGDVFGNAILSTATGVLTWNGRTLMTSPSNGTMKITFNDTTTPAQLQLGSILYLGTIPTVTGTGTPTIATGSTDSAGEVTSGTLATSVIITFASSKTNSPFCTVTDQSQLALFTYTISTTAITITQTATTGNKIDYHCSQH